MFDRNKRLDEIQKLIEQMLNFTNSNYGAPNLGEPTSIESFEEDGCTFEKKTWVTENGVITTIEMTNSPMDRKTANPSLDEVSLQKELAKAIEEERYEDAAKIRDSIKNKKITLEEIVENQGLDEEDEWNF